MIFSRQQNPTMQMRPVTFLRVLLLSCVHVKRKPITAPFFILLLFFFCTFLLASLVAFFSFSEFFGGKVRLFSCCVGIAYGCPLDHFTRSCIIIRTYDNMLLLHLPMLRPVPTKYQFIYPLPTAISYCYLRLMNRQTVERMEDWTNEPTDART